MRCSCAAPAPEAGESVTWRRGVHFYIYTRGGGRGDGVYLYQHYIMAGLSLSLADVGFSSISLVLPAAHPFPHPSSPSFEWDKMCLLSLATGCCCATALFIRTSFNWGGLPSTNVFIGTDRGMKEKSQMIWDTLSSAVIAVEDVLAYRSPWYCCYYYKSFKKDLRKIV